MLILSLFAPMSDFFLWGITPCLQCNTAPRTATSAFDGDAIAQYMRTDFITLPEHLGVWREARELFVPQLTSDDIPGQVFVVAGKEAARQFIH